MGVTIAFCDRFNVEELGFHSGELRHGLAFEYVSQRSNVSFTSQRWRKTESAPAFAHIGEAVQGFLEGKEFSQGFGDVLKRTELHLGLRKPSPNVELSSRTPMKGETIAVLVSLHPQRGFLEEIARFFRKDARPEARVRVLYDGCEVPALPTALDSKLLRALVPTTPLTPPGARAVKVEVGGEVFEGAVEVTEREYPVESIWLPKTKATIRGTVMEKEKVGAFLGTVSAEQMWRGPFTLPSDGEVTTGYGLQRYYNGVFADHDGEVTTGYGLQRYYNGVFANQYYHRGVDYGAWEGDPVRAPAHGRVALVGKEKDGYEIHGNCVGLDHGHGVTSIMMHLNSSFVKEGEMVQAGQIIGTVGETGIATGPHLHWGLHVRGEAVDPQPWMQAQKWI